MTALELFTRQPPFYELKAITAVIHRIMHSTPDRPSKESTLCRMTDEWWEICASCWKHDPASRPRMVDIVAMIHIDPEL
ncbi:hypothetical protein ID866_8820 [Astraeus odoratus]|nr:hypothetical protein ID866_8820 [Astraeus odoratus]